jgi:uncharacterized cupredoxin-like copper-binding protein
MNISRQGRPAIQKTVSNCEGDELEEGKRMLFEPAVVEVRLGEQIRFVIYNEGTWNHEFVLATEPDNRKHAELMKKFADMEHNDPNAIRLSPFSSAEASSIF